ncbi:MAG TPA: hypothetical protein IGR64_05595 [Leptolyngbyaceae cyanobacterium M65_K2018_010]|nr:hypothetical protein [Leptolyngbyaceae cyanobacterium M65_K2018_010]
MSQTIVNLTLPIVAAKINEALSDGLEGSEGRDLAIPELRQKLTAYVLSRLPVVYITLESEMACSMDTPTGCYSYEQQTQIEQLIQQGLASLLERQQTWSRRQEQELVEAGASPSSWFG